MVLALFCSIAAGCAGAKHAQKTEPVPAAPPAASMPVPEVAPAPTAPEAEAAPAIVETPEARATAVPPPAIQPARPAAPVPAPQPKTATTPAAPPPSAAPLDLKLLEARLRQTRAIGVLTKLSLKNQVDDLLERFRAYHKRQGTAKLADLRRNYDMLLLKVLSLLQDSDPPLARDIVKSRAAIWSILVDPRKFTESNLMAGATP